MRAYKLLCVAALLALPLMVAAIRPSAASARVEQDKSALEQVLGEKSTVRKYTPTDAQWTSIPIEYIAEFELSYSATHTLNIPYAVPSDATEVLVYAVVNVGASGPDSRTNVKIYTQDSDYNRYEKYIAVHPYPQSAWSTNSENMWFPLTKERKFYVEVPRSDEGNSDIELYVIGYRQ